VEKNLLSGWGKTLAAVLLLFAASTVSASPTVISGSSPRTTSLSADRATGVVTYNLGSNAVCDQMSEFGRAFLQPQLPDSRTAAGNNRCLPAVPPAIAMVLTGFFCISLIRDRRAWLTVLSGLLWVSQMGIGALPELTSRISRKIHTGQLIDTTLALPCLVEGDYYPDGYSEEIRYTGLLHHLAGIPQDVVSAFTNKRVSHIRLCRSIYSKGFGSIDEDTRAFQAATVLGQLALSKLSSCLVSGTRQFVCFTPAFIFCQLPRGPPISKMRLFCKPQGV
jgi:hypothetical protein